ncbi:hypothetical protein [Haloarchaeobius sp. DYHT-AS-18]|uniref:hypothetical protein n=1 Tax=Haloarchaeobius sp. DYHT-AS-18 TaxID=3446117 RepID=UPI003EBE3FBB
MSRDDPPADQHGGTDPETTTSDADSMPDHDPDTTDIDSTDRAASDDIDTDHEDDTAADEDVPVRDAEPAATDRREAQGREPRRSQRDARTDRDLRTKLSWLALGVLTLVSLYMLGVFYSNASRFIRLWVGTEFEPLVQAAFALVLLALSLVGIVRITRGLTESNAD